MGQRPLGWGRETLAAGWGWGQGQGRRERLQGRDGDGDTHGMGTGDPRDGEWKDPRIGMGGPGCGTGMGSGKGTLNPAACSSGVPGGSLGDLSPPGPGQDGVPQGLFPRGRFWCLQRHWIQAGGTPRPPVEPPRPSGGTPGDVGRVGGGPAPLLPGFGNTWLCPPPLSSVDFMGRGTHWSLRGCR